jgi:hypothetical protein
LIEYESSKLRDYLPESEQINTAVAVLALGVILIGIVGINSNNIQLLISDMYIITLNKLIIAWGAPSSSC